VDTRRTYSTLANQRASVEEGKEESKKDKKTSKYKHVCQGDYCLSKTFKSNRPNVKSPEAACGKCTNLNVNLKAPTSKMEALLLTRLAKSDLRECQLRPIYDLFESTKTSRNNQRRSY